MCAVLLFSPILLKAGVLDDFSTDNFSTNYNFVTIFENPVNAPAVVSGQGQIRTGPGTGAFIWNRGESLANAGDTVSIDFGFNTPLEGGGSSTASSAGMALFSTVTGTLQSELRVNIDSGILHFTDGSNVEDLSVSPVGLMTLSVTVDAVTASSISISYSLSGGGIDTIEFSDTLPVTELFFGPAGFGLSNDDAVHDNLLFSRDNTSDNSAKIAQLKRKIKKLQRQIKKAKRAGDPRKARKLKRSLKRLKRQLSALQ